MRSLFIAACAYLVFSLFARTSMLLAEHGFVAFGSDIATRIVSYLETDKGILGWARLLHFLALAYVVSRIRLGDMLLKLPGAGAIAEAGRHSLSVFCAGAILAMIARIILWASRSWGLNPLVQGAFGVVVVAIAVAMSIALALYLSRVAERRLPPPKLPATSPT